MAKTLNKSSVIGVIGLGTMGIGIVQVAARFGHRVFLYDANQEVLKKAKPRLEEIYERQMAKGKLTKLELMRLLDQIVPCETLSELSLCSLIIEAVVEDLDIKKKLFAELETAVSSECILATNTSSLSVSAICAACKNQGRVVGAHFFNPATAMPLVEVIAGLGTSPETVQKCTSLFTEWGKTTVVAKDTPAFIVNRVARPYYGEALRILEENLADVPTIDWAMTEIGGFKMGPFQLMDFIGNDVNYKVTQSVFEAFYYDPRYRPSLLQKQLIEAKRFGIKTNIGFYDYHEGATNPPPVKDKALGEQIFFRILSMLINEAADAVYLGVAGVSDIDLAMTKGVNYPKGLLLWADEIGLERIVSEMTRLMEEYHEDRYRLSPLLRKLCQEKKSFYGTTAC